MDALGNKDSIIVGYDPLATDSLDTAFNETDIKNTPINSLLDVRISKKQPGFGFPGSWPTTYQTKKQIQFKRCSNNNFPIMTIEVKAKYTPLTVTWNKVPYNTPCLGGSVFTSVLPGGWWDTGSPSSLYRKELAIVNSGTFTANYNSLYPPNNSNYAFINSSDTISIFWFKFSDISLLTTNIIEQSNNTGLIFYPNPATDILNIETGNSINEFTKIEIINSLGQIILEEELKNNSINIKDLPNGVYLLNLFNSTSTGSAQAAQGDREGSISKRFVIAK
ncbi:MAG: T9SS type A sorting domain-containing protein, partial [Bacteroidia bacterium]